MAIQLDRALTALLALTAGVGAANIYYAQPMVGLFAATFGVHGAVAAQVATASQVGYTVGIITLVPLGDRYDRRRIILVLAALLVMALLVAAAAPTLPVLMAAALFVGAGATLAQQAVPLAGSLADEATRGAVVGRVVSGLLAGILLARTLSGLVGEFFGWRAMFVLGAAMAAALFLAILRRLPPGDAVSGPATSGQTYPALLFSLVALWRRHPALRRAAIVQGCAFGGFTAFWATLALLLQQAPYHLGADAAGLFGVVGLAGILAAPLAGRWSDRHGPWRTTLAGLLTVLGGWAVLWLVPGLAGIGLGVVVLDTGIQVTLIGNQARVFSLEPAAQSRLNTVFVAGIFIGGALGSVLGSLAWGAGGWPCILLTGVVFSGFAVATHLTACPAAGPAR